jgi:uncharacterized protein YndB with AHSA1/START domain
MIRKRRLSNALNDIDVKAPPEVVWKLLVDAENWSSYFPAEDQVKILTGEPELALGTKYSRVTVGFPMKLIVTECVLRRRLAWSTVVDGDETGSSAYHGWVITPTDNGCHVLSEETQQGPFFLEEIGRKHTRNLRRQAVYQGHDCSAAVRRLKRGVFRCFSSFW